MSQEQATGPDASPPRPIDPAALRPTCNIAALGLLAFCIALFILIFVLSTAHKPGDAAPIQILTTTSVPGSPALTASASAQATARTTATATRPPHGKGGAGPTATPPPTPTATVIPTQPPTPTATPTRQPL